MRGARELVLALALFGALVGCSGGAPDTLAGCASLSTLQAREDCRLSLLEPVFRSGDRAAFEEALATLQDPVSRDLVRLRLAVGDPSRASDLCTRVETEDARRKCQQVLGRPHLRAPRP